MVFILVKGVPAPLPGFGGLAVALDVFWVEGFAQMGFASAGSVYL